MCWISTTAVPLIAEENIEIFKICEGIETDEVASYYRLYFYTLNQVYKLVSPIVIEFRKDILPNKFSINRGFHSYIKECTIKKFSIYKSLEVQYNGRFIECQGFKSLSVHCKGELGELA